MAKSSHKYSSTITRKRKVTSHVTLDARVPHVERTDGQRRGEWFSGEESSCIVTKVLPSVSVCEGVMSCAKLLVFEIDFFEAPGSEFLRLSHPFPHANVKDGIPESTNLLHSRSLPHLRLH